MSQDAFLDIIRMKELGFNEALGMPLFPLVQHTWDGKRLADWMKSARLVNESRLPIIEETLDGCSFLEGGISGVLTREEIQLIDFRLRTKISKPS